MYVCMYVCMYACMYVCMYACMYVYMCVCMCVCKYVQYHAIIEKLYQDSITTREGRSLYTKPCFSEITETQNTELNRGLCSCGLKYTELRLTLELFVLCKRIDKAPQTASTA